MGPQGGSCPSSHQPHCHVPPTVGLAVLGGQGTSRILYFVHTVCQRAAAAPHSPAVGQAGTRGRPHSRGSSRGSGAAVPGKQGRQRAVPTGQGAPGPAAPQPRATRAAPSPARRLPPHPIYPHVPAGPPAAGAVGLLALLWGGKRGMTTAPWPHGPPSSPCPSQTRPRPRSGPSRPPGIKCT